MPKSILEKLGWRPGSASQIFQCPEDVLPLLLPIETCGRDQLDWQLRFVMDSHAITNVASAASQSYGHGGHLWMAYPKLSGSIRSDINRDKGWDPLLVRDFLPVTLIAINADWSALRFRHRTEIKTLTRRL